MIPLAAESIRLGTEGHGIPSVEMLSEQVPARDSPVLPGRCSCLARPNPLPDSFNPTNSLNKIGKDFLQLSYAFLPDPNTIVCLGSCNAPKQNRKSHKAFLTFHVVFLAAQTEGPSLLLFCLWVAFSFSPTSPPPLPHPRLSRALVLTVRALREQRRKMCSQS